MSDRRLNFSLSWCLVINIKWYDTSWDRTARRGVGIPASIGPLNFLTPSPNNSGRDVVVTLMCVGTTEYAPCKYEGISWGDTKQAPISSAATSDTQLVSIAKDFLTNLVRVRAMFLL